MNATSFSLVPETGENSGRVKKERKPVEESTSARETVGRRRICLMYAAATEPVAGGCRREARI